MCLSPNDREEGSTARWVNPESPLRPAVALSFVLLVVLVVINHQKYFLPTHSLSKCMLMATTSVDLHSDILVDKPKVSKCR